MALLTKRELLGLAFGLLGIAAYIYLGFGMTYLIGMRGLYLNLMMCSCAGVCLLAGIGTPKYYIVLTIAVAIVIPTMCLLYHSWAPLWLLLYTAVYAFLIIAIIKLLFK